MAYHTKYRPDDFAQMIGNKAVVSSVQKILSKPRAEIPHAWMFTGHTGSGKTTIARIIAAKLGATGSGLFEQNAAQVRGIDDIRDIITQSQYRVPGSPVSVFILDECHQLTKEAQNALLKVLEDPPEHAYFILCTTDPQKLIDTIHTRCASFKFAPLQAEEMVDVILNAADAEKLELSEDMLMLLANRSGGSPRLALTMLERVATVKSVEEAEKLLAPITMKFQVEGDFEISGKILDILIKQKNAKIAWPLVARVLDNDVYANHADIVGVKTGLASRMGRFLLKTFHPGMAEAVLLIEMNKDFYTNASFTALMLKIVKVVCEQGASTSVENNEPR